MATTNDYLDHAKGTIISNGRATDMKKGTKRSTRLAFIYLFLLASRAALIKGANVRSDSAFWKNGCCTT